MRVPGDSPADAHVARPAVESGPEVACYHCGLPCPEGAYGLGKKSFCCMGCRTVHELLYEHGLGQYYDLERTPGIRVSDPDVKGRFDYLDDPAIQEQLLLFADGPRGRVTWTLPAIHCVACVWLLENLYRLHPAIGRTRVHFTRKEVTIDFNREELPLSGLAALLTGLGYEPSLQLDALNQPARRPDRGFTLKIGLAGFAFGNIMLFSFATYFGLTPASDPILHRAFQVLSLLLSVPVLLYSASDYFKGAWQGLRRRLLTIDFPLALGIAALFAQSLFEVFVRGTEGYFDSFTGLVFFLLCGRWFQARTYDALSFDRDYRAYFPLSVNRLVGEGEQSIPVSELKEGDRFVLRNGELAPADATLVSGQAVMDYAFVTGESEPVVKEVGEHLYAGGRQTAGRIVLQAVKEVSESYLTSLWNQDALRKEGPGLESITDRVGRIFTVVILALATATALFWWFRDPSMSLRTFTAVLIVACPCALALAAPFALGTALRLMGRSRLFAKNPRVIEAMARISAVVFDKTGTLTSAMYSPALPTFSNLDEQDVACAAALASQSTHPVSRSLAEGAPTPHQATRVAEEPGKGLRGDVAGRRVLLGSADWLKENGVPVSDSEPRGPGAHLALDGRYAGFLPAHHAPRPRVAELLHRMAGRFHLALLTGDRSARRGEMEDLFGTGADLRFEQTPHDKLEAIRSLQARGEEVLMVGDGLNDAGGLKQSDVGISVADDVHAFLPACDAILDARALPRLDRFLRFAASTLWVVRGAFAVSFAYNVVGLSLAAGGHLSPLVCAVLMPASSVTVVLLSVGGTLWAARRCGVTPP